MDDLDEMIRWATSPFGMIVVGSGIAVLVGVEIWWLLKVFRRRR